MVCSEAMTDLFINIKTSYFESPTGVKCNQLISNSPVMDFVNHFSDEYLYCEPCNYLVPDKESVKYTISDDDFKLFMKECFVIGMFIICSGKGVCFCCK